MAHKVAFHARAAEDLDAIDDLIAQDSPERAYAFVQRLREQCLRLAEFPDRGVPRPDLHPGLRTIAFVRRAVIAYQVADGQVLILRIFYAGQAFDSDDIP